MRKVTLITLIALIALIALITLITINYAGDTEFGPFISKGVLKLTYTTLVTKPSPPSTVSKGAAAQPAVTPQALEEDDCKIHSSSPALSEDTVHFDGLPDNVVPKEGKRETEHETVISVSQELTLCRRYIDSERDARFDLTLDELIHSDLESLKHSRARETTGALNKLINSDAELPKLQSEWRPWGELPYKVGKARVKKRRKGANKTSAGRRQKQKL